MVQKWKKAESFRPRGGRLNHDGLSLIVALCKLVNEPWRLWTKDVSQHFGYEAVWIQTNLDMNQGGSNQRVDNPGNIPFCRKFFLASNHVGFKPRWYQLGLKVLTQIFFRRSFCLIFHYTCWVWICFPHLGEYASDFLFLPNERSKCYVERHIMPVKGLSEARE